LRQAAVDDAAAVASLLAELGYPNSPAFAREKLAALAASDADAVFVAEEAGAVVAVGHVHAATMFHAPGKLGRVMALVVSEERWRRGSASALMAELEHWARDVGCTKMEITSGAHRPGAHDFYERLGYEEKPRRFVKDMSGGRDG
jgi:GNAT superfamily N-acetyltransferase